MIPFAKGMEYVVVTKQGDPLLRPARARLIWAANTAYATGALGLNCKLVGGADAFSYRIESIAGKFSAYRALESMYGVERNFDICLLQKETKNQGWTAEGDFKKYVLPNAGVVHTRDPEIALACSKRNIKYILENHDEDYQKEFTQWDELRLSSPICLAIVAITDAVKRQLIDRGFPEKKIIVCDSGVNHLAAKRRPIAARNWRKALLTYPYRHLIAYTGGMQAERGIADILDAAVQMPNSLFVMAGGHPADLQFWRREILHRSISNIRIIGYQNFETVCELQQAADVAIFSRANGGRPEMTSPLKIFEYLLSGVPVVAASIPVTESFEKIDLALKFYDPAVPGSLHSALKAVISTFAYEVDGYAKNIEAGLPYIWEERQRKILKFIGDVQVSITF
jgi:glycosyltransferase involved in cell wall biosynthesis